MIADSATHALERLFELDFINDEQKRAALSHPHWRLMEANAGPAERLIWMAENGIASHAALNESSYYLVDLDDQAQQEHSDILDRTLDVLFDRMDALNAQHLDQLLAYGLITVMQRTAAARQRFDYALASPAHALVGLIACRVVTGTQFAAASAKVRAATYFLDSAARRHVLDETDALLAQALRERELKTRTQVRSAVKVCVQLAVACAVLLHIHYRAGGSLPSVQVGEPMANTAAAGPATATQPAWASVSPV